MESHTEQDKMMLKNAKSLLFNPAYSDVSIVCGDEVYPAHRIFLHCLLDNGGHLQDSKEIRVTACHSTTIRKALEFAYTGQYTVRAPLGNESASYDESHGNHPCTTDSAREIPDHPLCLADNDRNNHPSSLHLSVNLLADNLSSRPLLLHTEQAIISSLGILFSKAQFAKFIKEVFSTSKFDRLKEPSLNVIISNLNKFMLPEYPLIDVELLKNVPTFRDHLLFNLLEKQCRSVHHSPGIFTTAQSTRNSLHEMNTRSHFTNQKEILRTINNLFSNSLWSDLSIYCGQHVFPGHRAVLCPASGFFSQACDGMETAKQTPCEIRLDHRDPFLVRNVLEFMYKGIYSGSLTDSFGTLPNDSPVFHARMFAEAEFFKSKELKLHALDLLFNTLEDNLNRISLKEVIYEIYSPWTDGNHVAELRGPLLEFIIDELIQHQDWSWGWILGPLENCPEFGGELCHLLVSRGFLDLIYK